MKALRAGGGGGLGQRAGGLDIVRDLAAIEPRRIGDAPPGDVDDSVGREFRHRRRDRGAVAQIERKPAIAPFERRQALGRALRPHGRGDFMTGLERGGERRRADKSGGAGDEQPHSKASA